MATSKKYINCPDCDAVLELVPKPNNPTRLIAKHNCCGRSSRVVYETDAPAFPPPYLADRLSPSEHIPTRKKGDKQ